MIDLYRSILARGLFPLFEAARGRPTVPLLRYLQRSERRTAGELRELQLELLQRLILHATRHTSHYREVMAEHGLIPSDFRSLDALGQLPLLDRSTVRRTLETRTADAPPHWVIKKATSGTTGEPVVVKYNAESRHWRDATRWRAYGWGGYRIGMRALHYWGAAPAPASRATRLKIALDRRFKRDLYLDCMKRDEETLAEMVRQLRAYRPHVIVAYSSGAAALARYIEAERLRDWDPIPVLVGAERLWPFDRAAIERSLGPVFETYGSREVQLIGSECEVHDGLHTSMETMLVELVVREGGGVRAARPGEVGEIALTDLHNLACPMIRYVTGDLAVAREPEPCACGRGLLRIGPIEGRVTDTLFDGRGRPVGGLVFNVLLGTLDHVARNFQVVQRRDGSVVMKVVPNLGDQLPEPARRAIDDVASKYLPGVPFEIEYVNSIPLTAAGKRNVVVVEKP
jgi:phenylacetate-CoA ligase